jgi:hypothetical protein
MGKMKITDLLGANAYSAIRTPLDIDADNFLLEAITTYTTLNILSPRTNLFALDYKKMVMLEAQELLQDLKQLVIIIKTVSLLTIQ